MLLLALAVAQLLALMLLVEGQLVLVDGPLALLLLLHPLVVALLVGKGVLVMLSAVGLPAGKPLVQVLLLCPLALAFLAGESLLMVLSLVLLLVGKLLALLLKLFSL